MLGKRWGSFLDPIDAKVQVQLQFCIFFEVFLSSSLFLKCRSLAALVTLSHAVFEPEEHCSR